MAEASQRCRVCGVEIPAGFTNCDACYVKAVLTDEKTFHSIIGRSKKTTSTLKMINQDKE